MSRYFYAALFVATIVLFLVVLFFALAFIVTHPEMCCG
jgi:hypothetical protein